MEQIKKLKVKGIKTKQHYYNIVVELETLEEIKQLREMGVNFQPMVRNFIKNKIDELKPTLEAVNRK